ncbi:MAG: TadE/TadG family type IV pilus assembly protein [Corticimicrobacter sp.]|uniref:TadE/TadG family type IV pilus assembly protein n=1 Tax=Corticimicrobacter sp. TaxID=2678536 RepID=UPI0032DA12A1
MSHSPPPHHRGAGTLEFTLAALPLLGMGMLVAETAHWHQQRLLLRHALHESARAGSTAAASPETIRAAFLASLPTPLRQHMATATQWQLQVLSPSSDSHADFSQHDPVQAHTPVIRHDYQQEQHHTRLAQGWPDGRGPHSGQTIFEANTLHLALDYPHRPWLPGLPAVPIHVEVRVGMQSHARHWPEHGTASSTDQQGTPPPSPVVPTRWPATTPTNAGTTAPTTSTGTAAQTGTATPIGMDEPLCGIALCCGTEKGTT